MGHVDKVLWDTHLRIKTATDPESEGMCDKGEYFIGIGFCAMQRYLTDVLQDKNIDKGTALLLGPKTVEGLPISMLIHLAGNYWKHSSEWHIGQELEPRSQNTINRLFKDNKSKSYPLSEVLADLSDSEHLSFLNFIPFLKKWRQAVDKNLIQKNT